MTDDYKAGLQAHTMGVRYDTHASTDWQFGWLRGEALTRDALEEARLRRHERRNPQEKDPE